MAYQYRLELLADVFHVLRGIIADLRNFFVCASIAEPEPQDLPVNRIVDILVDCVNHIGIPVYRHNRTPK